MDALVVGIADVEVVVTGVGELGRGRGAQALDQRITKAAHPVRAGEVDDDPAVGQEPSLVGVTHASPQRPADAPGTGARP